MIKYFLTAVILCSFLITEAQNSFDILFRNSTFASDNEQLPFWYTANRYGKIISQGSFLNVSEVYFHQNRNSDTSLLNWTWGADLVAGLGKENYLQLNQLFATLSFKRISLKGGLFHDNQRFSGLSTTNGNIIRSMNARPYPMLRMSSGKNIPIPFSGSFLSFNFMYSEGLLNDDRFVNNARLHQKSFHLVMLPSDSWEIKLGFEHSVMWGGMSANNRIGKMPQDFTSYLRYISGSRGGNNFPETDQMNVAGNQLGTWQFEVKKRVANATATLYINHPFEDFSGVNFRNWPDNLFGIHISLRKGSFVNALLYEFTNTRQQSIRDSLYDWNEESGKWSRIEFDNYFNHGVYRSGYTHYQQVIGSPLFFPVLTDEGISRGIGSNRFFSHHAGMAGIISNHLKWKGMITFMRHYGTYTKIYKSPLSQISGLLELNYSNQVLPFELGLSTAADSDSSSLHNKGISLTIAKRW